VALSLGNRNVLKTQAIAMEDLSNWTPRPAPTNAPMRGRHVAIEPLDAEAHCPALWDAFGGEKSNDLLFHFGWPQMASWRDLAAELVPRNESGAFVTCVFCHPETGTPMGMANYMRIDEKNGVVEVGAVAHGAAMARSPASTEAHYLMARRVFDELGYRRYEWKLNNPNEASHRAARRFGFVFEGVFRQAEVKPYGNRDTAWYAMIDKEWPLNRDAFEAWLDPSNFDRDGQQKVALSEMTRREMPCGGATLERIDARAADAILELQRAAYARTREATGSEPIPLTWNYEKLMRECETWVTEDTEGLSAALILRVRPGDLYLESLSTHPRVAESGLGSALMQATIARARNLRKPAIRLITNARNPAQEWYRRLGFEIEREEPWEGRTVLHMTMHLG
jgi:RimJ/RimL family protein N-acetyltransferase/ribosomal protein S18 acetylase RimI-like enzyme